MSSPKKVLVIGGGIAGLTAAEVLRSRGVEVTLLEKSHRTGGSVRTIQRDGFLAEAGPNSFIVQEKELQDFLQECGVLSAAIDTAPSAKKRFIVRGGKARQVPAGIFSAITTPLFSLRGKLRLLLEPFIMSRSQGDESVANFVRRRLGREIYNYALNPLVAGVFAGNPEKLVVRHAFPKVWNLEQNYKSLIRGAFPNAKAKKKSGLYVPKRVLSFPNGMETLPKILTRNLGKSLRLNATLTELSRDGNAWRARWFTSASVCDFFEQDERFDAVVFAIPSWAWQDLKGIETELGNALKSAPKLYYPPVTTLSLAYKSTQVKHPLEGFGMLVPELEKRKILGSLWTSSFFPNRAPESCVMTTNYIGGSRQAELASLPQEEQIKIARDELLALLGISGKPEFIELCEHERAIPQYEENYTDFLASLQAMEEKFSGIHFCGNYRGGIAVGATLLNAVKLGKKILKELGV